MGLEKVRAVGSQNTRFFKWDDRGQPRIAQILVSSNSSFLVSLKFTYLDQDDGKLHTSEIMGSSVFTGCIDVIDVITFKGGSEYVTRVEGFYQYSSPSYRFKMLSIHTNLQVYNVFKAEDMSSSAGYTNFRFSFSRLSEFGGFHGSYSGGEIQSIGVYYNILQTLPPTLKPKHEVED